MIDIYENSVDVFFKDLDVGDVFKDSKNNLLVAIHPTNIEGVAINALKLSNYHLSSIGDTDIVTVIGQMKQINYLD